VGTKRKTSDESLVSIVDDDLSVRRSMQRLIHSFGFRTEAFGSAEAFLSSGCGEQTACLILDVRMPGMDGLELQRRLATEMPRLPIIFLTAVASDEEERRALQAGAIEFLRKPVSSEVLRQALRSVLGR
jgi:FixJ family two-component response regulator